MELRIEIEPDFETAEKLYPDVLKLLLTYTDSLDQNGDENDAEYQKLERRLYEMIDIHNGGTKDDH